MSYIIAIGAYLFLLMIYGLVIAHKKVKTADDMVTGGHRIPFIILVGSLLATWCGGGGITGNASIIYNGGPVGGRHHLCRAPYRHYPAVFHRGQGPQVQ